MVICNTRDLSSGTRGILLDPMCLCADCKIARSSQMHSDTSLFQQWLQSVSGSIFSYLLKPAASSSSSQNEPTLLSPSFPALFLCFCCLHLLGMEDIEKENVSVLASLSHLLIFIIGTGNVNFILHILTPLRKPYTQAKDKIRGKLTDDFWNQLWVRAWEA